MDVTAERDALFSALFRAHHGAVRRYVTRRAWPDAVDDVVAETFLAAWRRLDDVPADPLPWLLTAARWALRAALLRAFAALGDTERELVMLTEWDGLSAGRVAAVLGIGAPQARARIYRARRKLRRALADELDRDPQGSIVRSLHDVA